MTSPRLSSPSTRSPVLLLSPPVLPLDPSPSISSSPLPLLVPSPPTPHLCTLLNIESIFNFFSVSVQSILLAPDAFRSTVSLFPDGLTCTPVSEFINCASPNVLTDGVVMPAQPDLTSENYRQKMVSWFDSNSNPLMTVEPSNDTAIISTINLYVLNYPSEGFSLPNLQLYQSNTINPPTGSELEFDIINNNQYSQIDKTIRRTTLRLRTPMSVSAFLLKWTFTGLLNVSLFALAEIELCADELPEYNTQSISFLNPEDSTTTIVAREEFLVSKELTLTCTVLTQGSFVWHWKKGTEDIVESPTISLYTADGTRTSVLVIRELNFTDAGAYFCETMFAGVIPDVSCRKFDVQLPSKCVLFDMLQCFTSVYS